jgi:nucleoside-diphosphate-sugar epimerase
MREFLHVDDMAAASVHVMNLDAAAWQSHTEPTVSHQSVNAPMKDTMSAIRIVRQAPVNPRCALFRSVRPLRISSFKRSK